MANLMQHWILPPMGFVVLSTIGLLVERFFKNIGKAIVILAISLLWLSSLPIVGQWCIDTLQKQYASLTLPLITPTTHSAIVILGGGYNQAHTYPNGLALSEATLARLQYTAYLYHHTPMTVIASGGQIDGVTQSEPELMRDILQHVFHVPVALFEKQSVDTNDESQFVKPLLITHHIHTIYLVTHAWHMPRSMQVFVYRLQPHIQVIPAPMGDIEILTTPMWMNFIPSLDAFNATTLALHEYLGMLWYRLHGITRVNTLPA